jgi:Microtubule associated protein (MAP65/ASE1 family)
MMKRKRFLDAANRWDKCYYGDAQRLQFKPFYSDDFSEKLLDEHEAELEKIKKHFNENSHLFAMVRVAYSALGSNIRYLVPVTAPPITVTILRWSRDS